MCLNPGFHFMGAARHECEPVAGLKKPQGQGLANAAGGAGDENESGHGQLLPGLKKTG